MSSSGRSILLALIAIGGWVEADILVACIVTNEIMTEVRHFYVNYVATFYI